MASSIFNQVSNVSIQSFPTAPSKTEITCLVSSLKLAKMNRKSFLSQEPLSTKRASYLIRTLYDSRVSRGYSSLTFAQNISVPQTEVEAQPVTDSSETVEATSVTDAAPESEEVPAVRLKKRLKPFHQIMERISQEAISAATKDKDIPDIRPGDVVQLRVEVPENKKRISLLKGIVISRRNSGINTTFRIRRVLAGVGVEMVFPLYSPNIKEIKVLSHRKVRRAKLFYLRDKLARLSTV